MKFARIILFVSNVAEVADFYVKHFGMSVQPGASADWVPLESEGSQIAIHKAHGAGTVAEDSPVKIVFFCEDVDAAKEDFAKAGLIFGKTHSYGDLRFADATDPAGNPIQISNR